jgi:hypothetical protein
MDKSLRDHVLDLEKRLGGLNAILMERGGRSESATI